MDDQLQAALERTIQGWQSMAEADPEQAEDAADFFEQSFYQFIDVFRSWVRKLTPQPRSVEELLQLGTCQTIMQRLPEPLHLNFETEADLIIDNMERVEEDKYD